MLRVYITGLGPPSGATRVFVSTAHWHREAFSLVFARSRRLRYSGGPPVCQVHSNIRCDYCTAWLFFLFTMTADFRFVMESL